MSCMGGEALDPGGVGITGPTLREKRKVVTALFADLVGSTVLGERLDADEVRLIVGDAVARMVGVIESFGGTVKDLAGDGVFALFGAPVTHEDDAERAVRAGLRLTQAMGAYGAEVARAWGIEVFSARVGVVTGPVVLGSIGAGQRVEYAAFGDIVNTAARLQGSAAPGSVLVSESTRQSIQALFDWGEWRTLELKGKAEAVTACEAVAAPAGSSRLRVDMGVQARLVGRERELASARQVGDRLLAGSGSVLFLTGEAGVGKSRLVGELRTHLEHAPAARGRALWLVGRGVLCGGTRSYLTFRRL